MFPKIRKAEEEQIPPRKGRPGGARTLIMRKARGSTVQEEEGQPKVEKKIRESKEPYMRKARESKCPQMKTAREAMFPHEKEDQVEQEP